MDYFNPAMGGCSNCGGGFPVTPTLPLASNVASNSYTSPAPNQKAAGAVKPAAVKAPSMEEIANFTSLSPAQQEQQRQRLEQSGTVLVPGMPGYAGRGSQMQPAEQVSPGSELAPLTPTTAQAAAITGDSLQYLNGFLRTQIGRPVLVTFLIGTNTLTDRSGILLGVGINYILINETQTDDVLACDFYNIKFIRFYY